MSTVKSLEVMKSENVVSIVFEVNPSNEEYLITIVIPTYNRWDNLMSLLFFLDENVGGRTCVCIVDNDSSHKCDFNYIKSNIKRVSLKMFANKYHLGPDASVLRAIEIPNTPWIYLLGDSKIPRADYLRNLEDDCLNHPNAMGIVYRFRNSTEANVDVNNIEELQKNITDFGDLFLGGNSLISRRSIYNYFSIASMYTLTRMPHVLFHLMALKDGGGVHISNNRLIDKFVSKPVHYDPGLSLVECWSQFSLILTLPFSVKELKIINEMILDMESRASLIVFCKFCLLQIFRYKKDIRPHLLRVLRYRYMYSPFSFERPFVFLIYLISILFTPMLFVNEQATKSKK